MVEAGRTKNYPRGCPMKGCRPLTQDEVKDILESFAGEYAARDRCLFVLGTLSGFRISEMLSLRVKDVSLDGRVLDQVTVQRRNMKGKQQGRTVSLHPRAQAAIRDQLQALAAAGLTGPDLYLFYSRKGFNQPITRQAAHAALKAVAVANGLGGKVGTHSMRKTFAAGIYERAVDLQRNGAAVDPLTFVQQALGHRNVNSTVSYLSFREDLLKEAIFSL